MYINVLPRREEAHFDSTTTSTTYRLICFNTKRLHVDWFVMYSDLLLLVKKFYGSNLPVNRKRMCIRCKCSISFCFNAVSSRSTCSNVLVMYIRATWLKGNRSRGDNTNCINESFYCSYDTCTHAHTHAHTVNNGLAMGGFKIYSDIYTRCCSQ